MGNKQSTSNCSNQKENHLTFADKKKIFDEDHDKCRNKLMDNKMIEDISSNSDPLEATQEQLTKFEKQYKEKAKKAKITDLPSLLVQLTVETYMNKNIIIRDFDVFKKIHDVYGQLDLSEEELKKVKKVEERFQKEFDTKLVMVEYDLDKKLKGLKDIQRLGVNSNLKFNPEFQPNIMNINLTHSLLSNYSIGTDLAELIENSSSLQIVNFMINPTDDNGILLENFGLDGRNYQILYKLFKAVSNNRHIKSFFFHSAKDYGIIIPPEISTLIINKLQSETLIAFHLGYIRLSVDFAKKFFFQIVSTRSMLFLSLESKSVHKLAFDYFAKVVAKNNSIMALCLSGCGLKEHKEKIDKFKELLYADTTPIDICYFGERSLISSSK